MSIRPKYIYGKILLAALVLLSFVLPLANGSSAAPTDQQQPFRTAEEIKADYERRRAKLIEALLYDPGGNLWHTASKGLAAIYKEPVPPVQGLINLGRAAGADPKCVACCEPPAYPCGVGTGYWSLPLLIRAYYMFTPDSSFQDGQYAGRIPAEVADQIKGFYRSYLRKGAGQGYGNCGEGDRPRCTAESSIGRYDSPPYTYISHTDNHTTIQASTILLAAQMLKSESAEQAALYENWKAWWIQFLDTLAKRGFWETASPTYVERHLAPIYNLYDFAEDPLIKKKAGMLLDWYWAEISQELLHGVRGGAKMRVYWIGDGDRGALSARNDCMYGVYYLYFGDSDFENNPRMPHTEMYSAVFATSSYRPPDVILELGGNPHVRGSFEIKEKRKGSCFIWDRNNLGDQPYNSRRYAYVTPDYVLGSFQTDADKQFMPIARPAPHMQDSLIFATSPDARISWGERASMGSGHINVFQHRNVVIASKASHPELPLAYDLPPPGTLDRVEKEGGWLFIQEGDAYAAIQVVHNEILIIEAARGADYDNDFARFKAAIKQLQPAVGLANRADGVIEYTTTNGDVMWFPLRDSDGTCRYSCNCNPSDEKLPKLNGQVVDWSTYPLFASPYVNSEWDSGLIEVVFNNWQLTLDFRDPNNPIRSETDLRTPTPSPTTVATETATPRPSPTATGTSTPTLSPTTTDTPMVTPTPSPTPPGEDETGSWLTRLLRVIRKWISSVLRFLRDMLPSNYPGRRQMCYASQKGIFDGSHCCRH